jgi:hypothetical protein
LRGPNGLDLSKLKKDIQPWQETKLRRCRRVQPEDLAPT